MATQKPAAKSAAPAAKKAAPAAAKPAAKAVAKPAPAPEPEPVEETSALEVGTKIVFNGYGEDVPAEEQFLTAGETYEIAGFTEADEAAGDPGGDPYVLIPNPDFNSNKKESDDNPKTVAVAMVEGEYDVAAEEEVEEEVAAPAPAPAKTAAKGKKAAAAAEPAPAAKGKAVGKKAAPKAAEPEVAEEPEDPDALPELEGEDEEVLAMVSGDRNLIEVAQELEANAAQSEYHLGGVLYHIKKDKAYLEVEGGEVYNVPREGFNQFLADFFNIGYRKAMFLIDIYRAFTTMGIENPAAKMAELGWTKASKIARPMLAEGANVEDLIQLAETNTVEDLSTALKEQVTVGGKVEGGTKATRTTLKFRLMEQEGATVVGILDAVQASQSLKDIGEALVFILSDWASTNIPKSAATAAPRQTAVGKPAAKVAAKPAAKKAAAKA